MERTRFVDFYDFQDFSLNDRWYFIALLDLTTCSNFQPDPHWISQRLGISIEEVFFSTVMLEKAGLLKCEDGTFKKVDQNLIIPTESSREKVRQYHKVMSQKAIDVMEKKTSQADFQKRLITGSTIAANPAKIEKAKEILSQAQIDIIKTLTEGDCTELYHLNMQLFPLLNEAESENEN